MSNDTPMAPTAENLRKNIEVHQGLKDVISAGSSSDRTMEERVRTLEVATASRLGAEIAGWKKALAAMEGS